MLWFTLSSGGSQYDASSGSSTLYGQGYGAQQQQPQQPEQQQPQQFQPFPQGGLPPRASITTNETIEDEQVDDDDDDDEDEVDAAASGFDYFGNVGQVQVSFTPVISTDQGKLSSVLN